MKKITEETKLKMSIAAKARCTSDWRKQRSTNMTTKIDGDMLKMLYDSGLTKIDVAEHMGVGRKVIENAMKRLGIKARKAVKRDQWGSKNHMWKGDEASIGKLHTRLYRRFGKPGKCEVCGTTDEKKSYDWANLTGNYKDVSDFKRMCRSCHWKYDNKILNLGRGINGHSQ